MRFMCWIDWKNYNSGSYFENAVDSKNYDNERTIMCVNYVFLNMAVYKRAMKNCSESVGIT